MKHAMNALPALACRACLRRAAVLVCAAALTACGALPQPPQQPQLYDLGLSSAAPASASPSSAHALALDSMETPAGVGLGTTLYYRLAYANDQQLRPYQRARWSHHVLVVGDRSHDQVVAIGPRHIRSLYVGRIE